MYSSIRSRRAPWQWKKTLIGAVIAGAFPQAALNLDFTKGWVDPRITYSGGANGTVMNSAGVIVAQAAPRFDYNPVTLQPLGLLVEEARTNLSVNSSAFGDGSWSNSNTTVTLNAATSLDGTINANSIVETAVAGFHGINRVIATTAGQTYTFSIFLKPIGNRQYAIVRINDAASNANAVSVVVDMVAGTISTAATAFGTFTNPSNSTPVKCGNGWVRFSVTAAIPVTSVVQKVLTSADGALAADGQGNTFVGDVTKGIYGWGVQFEQGAFPTSYIPTTAAAVTRSADVATFPATLISDWTQGTVVVEGTKDNTVANGQFFEGWPATSSGITVGLDATGGASRNLVRQGASRGDFSTGNDLANGTTFKVGLCWSAAAAPLSYMNGVSKNFTGTPAEVDFAANTVMNIGRRGDGTLTANCHIRRIKWYRKQAPAATLKRLTT